MRHTATALAALLVLTLTACSEDPEEPADAEDGPTTGQTEAEETEETEETEEAAEVPGACELADAEAVEAAYGQQVPPGQVVSGGHDDSNGVQWQSDNCDWEAPDALEVSLQVAQVEDFEVADEFCPELSYLGDPATPVDGLGDRAAWVVSEDPDEVEATLRVCTGEVMFDIEVDSALGTDVEALRDQTVTLAGTVLGNLEG